MTTAAASVKGAIAQPEQTLWFDIAKALLSVLISASDCDTQIVGTVQEDDGEEQ